MVYIISFTLRGCRRRQWFQCGKYCTLHCRVYSSIGFGRIIGNLVGGSVFDIFPMKNRRENTCAGFVKWTDEKKTKKKYYTGWIPSISIRFANGSATRFHIRNFARRITFFFFFHTHELIKNDIRVRGISRFFLVYPPPFSPIEISSIFKCESHIYKQQTKKKKEKNRAENV